MSVIRNTCPQILSSAPRWKSPCAKYWSVSRFLYFPEESHWVLSPQNSVLWHRVFFDWLDRYLK